MYGDSKDIPTDNMGYGIDQEIYNAFLPQRYNMTATRHGIRYPQLLYLATNIMTIHQRLRLPFPMASGTCAMARDKSRRPEPYQHGAIGLADLKAWFESRWIKKILRLLTGNSVKVRIKNLRLDLIMSNAALVDIISLKTEITDTNADA